MDLSHGKGREGNGRGWEGNGNGIWLEMLGLRSYVCVYHYMVGGAGEGLGKLMAMAMAMATVGPMGVIFVSASEYESLGGLG